MGTPPPASEIATYYHSHTEPMSRVMGEACAFANGGGLDSRQRPIFEGLDRAAAWMRSLSKLDGESDLQAIHVACRTLLELTIDAALFHHDKTERSVRKLLAFEQSQRLVFANGYKAYIERTKRAPGPGFVQLLDFGNQRRDEIKRLRRQEWSLDKHPSRWTGERGLRSDAIEADENAKCTCWSRAGFLEEMLAERYAPLNWYTHGSGMTGLRGIDDLSVPGALTIRDSLCLASMLMSIAVHEVPHIKDAPIVRAELVKLHAALNMNIPMETP